jgi:hypothetical protein
MTAPATMAFFSPLRMRGLSCVARTFTSANSAATKNPLSAMKSTATARPITRAEVVARLGRGLADQWK